MSGDLEDFLRRAAQRRQSKAAESQGKPRQGKPNAPGLKRVRPEYSNRKTERMVPPAEADEVLMAEIVEQADDSVSARMQRLEESKRAAARAEQELAKKRSKARAGTAKTEAADSLPSTNNATQELLAMLRRSDGIRQAVLLNEILNRPEHRW